MNDKLEEILKASGLKVARQSYEYKSAGQTYTGENIYAILHAPRGDATEAIVLVAAWKNMEGKLNRSGIPLILTLARYFKRMGPFPPGICRTNIRQVGLYGLKTLFSW